MRNRQNYIRHGFYIGLYGFVKYLNFPFSEYLRAFVIHLFAPGIQTTYIRDGVTIMFPWNVHIAKSASLNQGVEIDGFGGVTIGEGVRIASYCSINTADHEFDDPDTFIMHQGYVVAEVIIEDDVWIGTGTKINKGVRIGKGCVIGSGSVVTRDIPPYSVAAGVPCRVIRQRGEAAS